MNILEGDGREERRGKEEEEMRIEERGERREESQCL